jgi:hypothetical protein
MCVPWSRINSRWHSSMEVSWVLRPGQSCTVSSDWQLISCYTDKVYSWSIAIPKSGTDAESDHDLCVFNYPFCLLPADIMMPSSSRVNDDVTHRTRTTCRTFLSSSSTHQPHVRAPGYAMCPKSLTLVRIRSYAPFLGQWLMHMDHCFSIETWVGPVLPQCLLLIVYVEGSRSSMVRGAEPSARWSPYSP